MSGSRKETERTKLMQEKCQTLLTQMLRDEDNKYCVDCDAKGPRWASWNLGVFLCIRCAGIHRNLGVHISRVKSVNLDTWTPEQVISLQQMGNSRARAVYEAQLPDGFRRPQTDTALESFIRAKYEHKKYLAREWVPPQAPKVDWAKEIDEEIEKQKRKKKASQAGSTLILGGSSLGCGGLDKKSLASGTSTSSKLPPPLSKPKPSNSPKTSRSSDIAVSSGMTDLLGLTSPTNPIASGLGAPISAATNLSSLLSAPIPNGSTNPQDNKPTTTTAGGAADSLSSLAKEEEDFFNQTTLTSDRDKSGKLTKDSILALYASAPPTSQPFCGGNPGMMGFNAFATQQTFPQQHQPQQQQQPLGALNIGIGGGLPQHNQFGLLAGMQPGLLGQPHHQQPQHPPTQFMTPPNSATMYNAPVMTAPAAFTSALGQHQPMMGVQQSNGQFGQFQSMPANFGAAFGGGIMATGDPHGMMRANAANQPPASNLNQQFGNLNIGNVWQ